MLKAIGCALRDHRAQRAPAIFRRDRRDRARRRRSAALEAGLKPIVCVGERLEQREAGATEAVLAGQFAGGLGGLTRGAVRAAS